MKLGKPVIKEDLMDGETYLVKSDHGWHEGAYVHEALHHPAFCVRFTTRHGYVTLTECTEIWEMQLN